MRNRSDLRNSVRRLRRVARSGRTGRLPGGNQGSRAVKTPYMKISQLELFKVPPRWLFLKMTTSDGLVGGGGPGVEEKRDTVAAVVHELSGYVEGRNPDQMKQ